MYRLLSVWQNHHVISSNVFTISSILKNWLTESSWTWSFWGFEGLFNIVSWHWYSVIWLVPEMTCRKCLVLGLPVTCREGLSPGKGVESGFYHLEMSKTSKITFSIRLIWKFLNFFLSDFRRFLGLFEVPVMICFHFNPIEYLVQIQIMSFSEDDES